LSVCIFCGADTKNFDIGLKEYSCTHCTDKFYDDYGKVVHHLTTYSLDKRKKRNNPKHSLVVKLDVLNRIERVKNHICPECETQCFCQDSPCSHCDRIGRQ
jgi:hypothetical protein